MSHSEATTVQVVKTNKSKDLQIKELRDALAEKTRLELQLREQMGILETNFRTRLEEAGTMTERLKDTIRSLMKLGLVPTDRRERINALLSWTP